MEGKSRLTLAAVGAAFVVMLTVLVLGACTAQPAASPAAKQAEKQAPAQVAAPKFVGSETCRACHAKQYDSWRNTIHTSMVRPIAKGDLKNAKADLTLPGAPKADQYDWVYAIGGWYKEERYAYRNAKGDVVTGEFEYNKPRKQFVLRKDKEGNPEALDWINSCGGCHSTGLNVETRKFNELNIGCEACHGPGSEHAKDSSKTKIVVDKSSEACGQCHIRGSDTSGKYGFPVTYQLGKPDTLLKDFKPIPMTDAASVFPDQKNSNRHRQQFLDWGRSGHAKANVTCVACHDPHQGALNERKADLRAKGNDLCAKCHEKQSRDQAAHAGHALDKATCASCHLPKLIGSGSVSTHTFEAIAPAKTLQYGEKMANSCNTCHKDKNAEWADQQYKRIFKK
ncbi:MAG: hypothetical protein HYX92_16980 [Chloroflexi bacterium]|nr:hypothetical protein [Chloroflexota bacterium]